MIPAWEKVSISCLRGVGGALYLLSTEDFGTIDPQRAEAGSKVQNDQGLTEDGPSTGLVCLVVG